MKGKKKHWKDVTDATTLYLAKDVMSIRKVDNEASKELLKIVPHYDLLSCKSFFFFVYSWGMVALEKNKCKKNQNDKKQVASF